jgi:hypothetical protein
MGKGKSFIAHLHTKGLRELRAMGMKTEEDEFNRPESLPEHPEIHPKYYPESSVEIYYFQKYAMMLALANSQLKYIRELDDYIDYLEKKKKTNSVALIKTLN